MSKVSKFETTFNTYNVVELLGEGGAGRVYKVTDESGQELALKQLNREFVTKEKVKRFKNELNFCYTTTHPNIVKVLDWGFIDDQIKIPFFIMPIFSETLRSLMNKGIEKDNILPLFSQLLNGIEVAHLKSTWHRDLKPENILVNSQSNSLVIADWGIAHFSEDYLFTLVETRLQSRMANFQYAAPEQRIRSGKVDHRSDIYSLGMILNEMFTGKLLLGTGYVRIEDVDSNFAYLDKLVSMMIRQSPEDRPISIDEIKKILIARKNEFISRQKISQLKDEVIPQSEIDDPLVIDPIKIKDIDYQDGKLIVKLNQAVNRIWTKSFQDIKIYRPEILPNSFEFKNDTVLIPITENNAQRTIDSLKSYLEKGNTKYKETLEKEMQLSIEKQQSEIEKKIQEEETKTRILTKLKI